MVNMIGFHHKEPVYNTAAHGELGWYVRVHPRPQHGPLAALVTSPCAHGYWESPERAARWLDHPGDIPHLAAAYIEWASQRV